MVLPQMAQVLLHCRNVLEPLFFFNIWQFPERLFLCECRLDASVSHIVAAQMPYVFLPLDAVVI